MFMTGSNWNGDTTISKTNQLSNIVLMFTYILLETYQRVLTSTKCNILHFCIVELPTIHARD
jgi:hypothetical protein